MEYTGKPQKIIEWLFFQDREQLFDIKEHKEKRSLTANSYFWVLVTKIADTLRASKEDVYMQMLKRYGQSEIVSVVSSIDVRGYFKYYEKIGTGHVEGKEFSHYRIFKGSSEYDSREMAILIDGAVSEAEEMGIQTLPPDEIAHLKTMWHA